MRLKEGLFKGIASTGSAAPLLPKAKAFARPGPTLRLTRLLYTLFHPQP